jgi:hypothetical protein
MVQNNPPNHIACPETPRVTKVPGNNEKPDRYDEKRSDRESIKPSNFGQRVFLVLATVKISTVLQTGARVLMAAEMGNSLRHALLQSKNLLHVILFEILAKRDGSAEHLVINIQIQHPDRIKCKCACENEQHRDVQVEPTT